jgi:hypothetical protein
VEREGEGESEGETCKRIERPEAAGYQQRKVEVKAKENRLRTAENPGSLPLALSPIPQRTQHRTLHRLECRHSTEYFIHQTLPCGVRPYSRRMS